MNSIDVAVLVVVGVSTLIAGWRGLVRSLFSLIGWVSAFALAFVLGAWATNLMPIEWSTPTRVLLGYGAVFVVVLVLVGLVGRALGRLVQLVGLGGVDRFLGAAFGFARGVLVIVAMMFIIALTPLANHHALNESLLLPWISRFVQHLAPSGPLRKPDLVEA
ncbi:MAG TPA: CvpA family protein [Burkholderiaceae bacterium]|nr:CvpA family protein [Burkholderiaceae bacterium]